MAIGQIHVGDQGTDFQLEVQDTDKDGNNSVVDLSGVSTMEIIFTDPDGNETTKTASIANLPGSDGIISFVNNDSSFIDEAGLWFYRAKLTYSSGNIFQSNDVSFEVLGSVE